ncbi:MAG TPA: glycosyl hydrolase, partial [Flavisolibacter sp.]|nr:glycosyl hydrolase [Flavisolibacter sp.]
HPTAGPGMTMGPWGIHFDRMNTWFEQGRLWLRYMARCQALLQQGLPVRDLLYFTGEEANIYTRVERNSIVPAPPQGYDYDIINAGAIINKVSISNGEIVLPHGMRYRVLVLQNFKGITLPLLRKLAALVTEGMLLVGAKPKQSLGLISQADEEAFRNTAEALWGSIDGKGVIENRVGKGLVMWAPSLTTMLQRLHIKPDFVFSSRSNDAPLLYVHRRTHEADVYFVCNQRRTTEDVVCSFRVKNKVPEVWDAATGTMMPSHVYETAADEIRLPLQLESYGSLFVVFRKPASAQRIVNVKNHNTTLLQTNHFQQRRRTLFPGINNNFSISLWAKPEMNIMTKPSVHMGNVAHPYTDYYAVYPSPGASLYGAGHAVCGLAIGRNGVAVWENENYPV